MVINAHICKESIKFIFSNGPSLHLLVFLLSRGRTGSGAIYIGRLTVSVLLSVFCFFLLLLVLWVLVKASVASYCSSLIPGLVTMEMSAAGLVGPFEVSCLPFASDCSPSTMALP